MTMRSSYPAWVKKSRCGAKTVTTAMCWTTWKILTSVRSPTQSRSPPLSFRSRCCRDVRQLEDLRPDEDDVVQVVDGGPMGDVDPVVGGVCAVVCLFADLSTLASRSIVLVV